MQRYATIFVFLTIVGLFVLMDIAACVPSGEVGQPPPPPPTQTATATATATPTPAPPPPPTVVVPQPAQPAGQPSDGGLQQQAKGNGGVVPGQRPANCPTDRQMQEVFDFVRRDIKPVFTGEGVLWDHCKWNHIARGVGDYSINVPADWQVTANMMDDTVQTWYGPVQLHLKSATYRYRLAYNTPETGWVNNPCELIRREDAFGQRRNPAYRTTSGNIVCGGGTSGTSVAPSGAISGQAQACPTFAGMSTRPLDRGACKFEASNKMRPVTGTVPRGYTADFWDNRNNRVGFADEGQQIFTVEATFKPK